MSKINTKYWLYASVASGAKHFLVEARHHLNVISSTSSPAFQTGAFQANAFQGEGILVIKLDGEAAKELGERISVLELAEKVLSFWRARLVI
jgi:hypothetical protein